MRTREQIIPLCRAEFLQDFTIELGLRLKPIRQAAKSVIAEVDSCEHEEQSLERLAVWIETWTYTRVSMALWEDRTVWIAVALLPTQNNKQYQISFYPASDSFTADGLVEALRNTVSVSSRLCYGESPLPILRRIWKHNGIVDTKGSLHARQRVQ